MAEMMSEKELAEIRGLAEAATPGPWTWNEGHQMVGPDVFDRIIETDSGVYPPDDADAAFIAASRSAVPRLLGEVERLRALLVDATEIIATLHASADDKSIGHVKVDTSHGRNYLPYAAEAWLADCAKGLP